MNDLMFLECTRQMPLMSLPVRTTVADLGHAKVMISPGSLLTAEQLKSAGEVTDLVAPSLLHCGGMAAAVKVFPQAKVWGPPGAAHAKPEIPWTHELSEKNWPFQSELKLIPVWGMPDLKENVFVHKKSKTLIVADLFFNMGRPPGFGPWLILSLFGTYGKFALSRFFKKYIKDKDAFKISAQKILEEDFETVAVGHGAIFHGGPAAVLKAFQERGFKV